jgi:hypothetical protein
MEWELWFSGGEGDELTCLNILLGMLKPTTPKFPEGQPD